MSKKAKVYNSEEGYDLYAPHYDKSQAYLNSFEGYDLFNLIGDIKGKEVLDVGCGTGRLARDFVDRGAILSCCDVSEEMLKILKKKAGVKEIVKGDIEELPFEDESFDVVVATFVIVHLKTLQEAFDEVYRVLKPGGHFVVTNINQDKAPKLDIGGEKIVVNSFYHRPQNVLKALEESFFEVEREEFVYESGQWINQIVKARKGE